MLNHFKIVSEETQSMFNLPINFALLEFDQGCRKSRASPVSQRRCALLYSYSFQHFLWQMMQRLKGLLYDKVAQRKNAWEYSIILYGLTFLTSIFGMQGFDLNNIHSIPQGFAILLVAMTVISITLFYMFWKRQWITIPGNILRKNNSNGNDNNSGGQWIVLWNYLYLSKKYRMTMPSYHKQ